MGDRAVCRGGVIPRWCRVERPQQPSFDGDIYTDSAACDTSATGASRARRILEEGHASGTLQRMAMGR